MVMFSKGVCTTYTGGNKSQIPDGFDRLSKAKAFKSFEFLAITSYTFLATALSTQNRKLLPINDLIRFNESLQFLKELNIEGESWAVLQSYQVLKKILYLMRLLMYQHPEYVEISGGLGGTSTAVGYVYTYRTPCISCNQCIS
ncbi:hypothetical protein GN958_ATG23432 [Phytophthora infestans]|uniref:Uncharacterized protein n=1 Tax=Phytophthora infestans TaxID=4787 RepID=A0A8S9THY3_PHYIN|nr:hypothetical protein GN958_ATG23432 [Phytophthora infestans]